MGNSSGKQWVLLAAGSKDWKYYRHQANVCHAYQVAHRNGIPDEQIVVMMYDDIAYNEENPFPGRIINVPDGPNVYCGVPKDYTKKEVSAKNFLAVLRGDSAAVRKIGTEKVIQSGGNDSIFIYLTDHGGCGIFHFPHTTLYAHDLIETVNAMSSNGKFAKMVIYLEACHSGSMLEELQNNGNVYAVASCEPSEKTYALFWDSKRKTFLSDVFTAHWLYHTKTVKLNMTSFGEQFSYLKKKVSEAVRKMTGMTETPCNYGDMHMLQLMLSEMLGQSPASRDGYTPQPLNFSVSDVVDSTEVPLIIQKNRIKNEQDRRKREAFKRQYLELVRFVVTHSHLQVLVNLCESGMNIERIKAAITWANHDEEITF
ncbi:legumain-like isoform X2 [Clarias gariepinus]|uniref:legumain-like isoform X2 n=1 Tax=Clarias gariepinus TaxID=13013 RepID=UPI00234C13C7|nr:legumain-like isoform X2 [Clarias gariepinus]